MRTIICVPWRGGEPHRERAWAWCRERWERSLPWPIVTADADPSSPFHRAASRNLAAKGRWDVAVFMDADCMLRTRGQRSPHVEPLLEAVRVAAEDGVAVLPHQRYVSLTETGTEAILRGRRHGWQMAAKVPRTTAIGGIIVIPRPLWKDVGGYDERFLGWGAEDGAMAETLRALGILRRLPGTLYQLYHPPVPGKYAQYRLNKPLRRRYASARGDVTGMRALIRERRT